MKRRSRALIAAASLICAFAIGAGLWAGTRNNVEAADHLDPPARVNPDGNPSADRAADIADVFVWHRMDGATQKVVFAMTYAGPNPAAADQTATYDPDVLYSFHINNDDTPAAEQVIHVRFGQNASNNWGMQVTGIPGATAAVVGPVETVNTIEGTPGVMFYAGLRDDPFFFDLQGFRDTLSSGELSFDNTRDFFADQNSSVIVIEVNADDIATGADDTFSVWGTTGRDS